MLNEAQIIASLKNKFPAIGDDAAILPFSAHQNYLITKDLLIEDVHFRRSYVDAISLGHKALHVNLSDLAAMGAVPKYILLGISIPESCEHYTSAFLESFTQACHEAHVVLVGGDTTKSPTHFIISVTAIGIAEATHIKTRSNAKPGDIICLVGDLGYAQLGFQAFEKNKAIPGDFTSCFLKPTARLREGLWLGEQPGVQAMMDVSDGLYIDLKKLCEASGVSADIDLDRLVYPPAFANACEMLQLDPEMVMLTGGEDYGLLVAVNPDKYQQISLDFSRKFGYSLRVIGEDGGIITDGGEFIF